MAMVLWCNIHYLVVFFYCTTQLRYNIKKEDLKVNSEILISVYSPTKIKMLMKSYVNTKSLSKQYLGSGISKFTGNNCFGITKLSIWNSSN